MASILFKNSLINEEDSAQKNLWFNLPEQTRNFIKEALQAQLGNEQESQIKKAAMCLAAIGCLELPTGKWP